MGLLIRLLILPFRYPIAGIVIGLAIIGGVLATDWDSAPTCGGDTMAQGDICHRLTDTDNSLDKTYDEAKADKSQAPYIWAGLGGVLVLSGAVSWPIRRRRAAARAAAAPGPTAGTPTAGTPTAGTPTAGTPTAGTPTAGTPTAGTPTAGTPTAGTPTAGTPTAGTPTAGTPTAGTPTAGTPTAETPATGATATS
ncbi:hypothetical protein [Actinoplanes sp. HUAS TT8]|uniref:hypothetical protein n=1 Tax=Actinoplanes sp. HUAS TT8 TaxID=3447453 RepID=UPI003F525EE3